MKLSVSTYSFWQYLSAGRLTQAGCVDEAARLGFDAVEIAELRTPDGQSRREYAAMLRRMAVDAGIPISSFTVGADFLNGSGGDVKAEIARVKELVDLGAELGVSFMRHDATTGEPTGPNARSFDTVLPILADACREIADYAAGYGIRTMVENHGFFCQDSSRVAALHKATAHPNFSLLCDIGNFLCAEEDPLSACAAVAPLTAYAHAKDFIIRTSEKSPVADEGWWLKTREGGLFLQGCALGQGGVPVADCLNLLKNAGFDGYVSLEYEGPGDCMEGIRQGFDYLRRWQEQS